MAAGGVEQAGEREAEVGLLVRGGAGDRDFEPLRERPVELGGVGHAGEPGQRQAVARLDRERPFIGGAGAWTVAQIFTQIAEIEQRRNVIGIVFQRGVQLLGGVGGPVQIVGQDHRAIEPHLLGVANPEVERARIGIERGLEAAHFALQPAEVVPAVSEVGLGGEQPLIGGDRLLDSAERAQPRRFAQQILPIVHGTHLNSRGGVRRG